MDSQSQEKRRWTVDFPKVENWKDGAYGGGGSPGLQMDSCGKWSVEREWKWALCTATGSGYTRCLEVPMPSASVCGFFSVLEVAVPVPFV